jgi:hypothetical protein
MLTRLQRSLHGPSSELLVICLVPNKHLLLQGMAFHSIFFILTLFKLKFEKEPLLDYISKN